MGQGSSSQQSQSQPRAGATDRQTRRRSIWGRSAVVPSETEVDPRAVPERRTRRPQQASTNRLSQLFQQSPQNPDFEPPSQRRPSRLQRARNSVLLSPGSLFPRQTRPTSSNTIWPFAGDDSSRSNQTLPTVGTDSEVDLGNLTTSVSSGSALPSASSRRSSLRLPNSISDRLAGLRSGRNTSNNSHTVRRGRSAPRQGEDNTALLSRLLSVAAAATAATLLDGNEHAISQARGTAVDGDDGSFEGFLQSLENGRLAAALRQGVQPPGDGEEGSTSGNTPLNFFRMFRFGAQGADHGRSAGAGTGNTSTVTGNSTSPNNQSQTSSTPSRASGDNRMVPIIIVGIRAITPGSTGHEDSGVPPFLDALSTLPTTPFAGGNNIGQDITNEILRGPQNGTRFSHRRRASAGGVGGFPSSYDNQRDHRSPDRVRPRSVASEAANWPRPPPATPASPNLSAVNSGTSTPVNTGSGSRRPSYNNASRRESIIRTTTTTTLETTNEDVPLRPRAARQRRVSDSAERRHSGYSSRRNGIVEPDHAPSENARSWIIYVLGGSYPENHPLLTTPSLFTDSPSYEDMMLLSTLLGPAKPPVASEQDVAESGGLYKIVLSADTEKTAGLVAAAVEGEERIVLSEEQRCLVCLSDFEEEEEARCLHKCNHLFHKECIDQWLTKGRNSCPLCRAQGVDETEKKPEPAPTDSAMGTPAMPSTAQVPAI